MSGLCVGTRWAMVVLCGYPLVACSSSLEGRADARLARDGKQGNLDGQRMDGPRHEVDRGPRPDGSTQPSPSCEPTSGGGSNEVKAPRLLRTFKDRWHEGWLASPAVADLDGDGKNELVVPRDGVLLVWQADGKLLWKKNAAGRIWASPVVADLLPARPGLEVVVASRGKILGFDKSGEALPGFPLSFRDELRSIAAGDINGNGELELVVVTTSPLTAGGKKDIVSAFSAAGKKISGFPPHTTGKSGCDAACYVTGGYDQNLALGDVNGDGKLDIFATQDNAYLSLHDGTGRAFDVASVFKDRKKWPGIRFMLDYELCKAGSSGTESKDEQAHFTNSAPAIADIDDDGDMELIVLGSVQNAAQTDRERGVVLFVLESDGQRPKAWQIPFKASDYLAGLWDFEGTNVVAATNQVTVADIDPAAAGKEMIFAGFDGHIHCVSADKRELWKTRYTSSAAVLTGGVVVADLSGDGRPEIVFASYSKDEGKSHLFILDSSGRQLHKVSLPKRGAMAVPTIADLDGDLSLEILVSLKDGEDKVRQVLAYTVDGSASNCILWPTGRANLLRNGWVR